MTGPPLVAVRTFLNTVEAELARTALEAAGIDAIVQSDDCGGLRPHLWLGGVRLLVREPEAARADEVLGRAATFEPPPDPTPQE